MQILIFEILSCFIVQWAAPQGVRMHWQKTCILYHPVSYVQPLSQPDIPCKTPTKETLFLKLTVNVSTSEDRTYQERLKSQILFLFLRSVDLELKSLFVSISVNMLPPFMLSPTLASYLHVVRHSLIYSTFLLLTPVIDWRHAADTRPVSTLFSSSSST